MNLKAILIFTALGWMILVLQTTVISYSNLRYFQPELLLILVVHTGTHRHYGEGVSLTLYFGYLMDVFSGRPLGSYLFVYVMIYLSVRLLGHRLLLRARIPQMFAVFTLTIAGDMIHSLLSELMSLTNPNAFMLQSMIVRGTVNAIGVLLLFPLLGRIERRLWTKPTTLQFG